MVASTCLLAALYPLAAPTGYPHWLPSARWLPSAALLPLLAGCSLLATGLISLTHYHCPSMLTVKNTSQLLAWDCYGSPAAVFTTRHPYCSPIA